MAIHGPLRSSSIENKKRILEDTICGFKNLIDEMFEFILLAQRRGSLDSNF